MKYPTANAFRTAKDMDLARYDNEPAATADLVAAGVVELGDYFQFAIEKTADLAAQTFEDITVDIGFGDPPVANPDMLRGSDLLSFAGIAPIEVPTLPLEQHIAEKVHAYTRSYSGDRQSSRVKDLIDLVLMSSHFSYQAGRLRGALRATFEARRTHELPATLPPPPVDWGTAYRKMASEVRLAVDVQAGYRQAAVFLDSILIAGVTDTAVWDPVRQTWRSC